MTSALDMSLDDLIKSNKHVGGGRGGGRGGKATNRRGGGNAAAAAAASGGAYSGAKTGGAARRQTNRTSARPNPYATAKASKRHPSPPCFPPPYNIGNARQLVDRVFQM
jgi:THO complex subunit 4